jgi:peptidoglycan/xylan/chitin deacetylase (PgdA/CDA1 family)
MELQSAPAKRWPRLRPTSAPRFAILCYHRVGEGGIPFYSELPADVFEAQVRYLRKNYRIISLDQMILEMSDPVSLEPTVVVTFDDGYRGLYTEAFPILKAYRIPATIFLTVESIETGQVAWYDRVFLALKTLPGDSLDLDLDRPRRFSLASPATRMQAAVEIISRLRTFSAARRKECCAVLESRVELPEDELQDRMLAWDQIRIMHRGDVCFGAHTMTHPVVSRLPPDEMKWEILESKRILEEMLDSPVRHFAFPFGKREECGEAAASVLAAGGYESAATTEWGVNSVGSDRFQLRRVQIGEFGSLSMFAFQLARLFLHTDLDRAATVRENSATVKQAAEAEEQRMRR